MLARTIAVPPASTLSLPKTATRLNHFNLESGWHPSIGSHPFKASSNPHAVWDDPHSIRSGLRRTLPVSSGQQEKATVQPQNQ
jgi:hypothetical protein